MQPLRALGGHSGGVGSAAVSSIARQVTDDRRLAHGFTRHAGRCRQQTKNEKCRPDPHPCQVKIRMSSDVLRSHRVEGVQKELAARLTALNVVRTIMLEAAAEHGVDPERLSFVHAVRAVVSFAPAFACEPTWKLPSIYRALLVEIASHTVPWRPGRLEPRAVRREVKHYPRLKTTRAQWRRDHAA